MKVITRELVTQISAEARNNLSHAGGNFAADIPHGAFHTAVSLESGTVFYETKAGPYRQLEDSEKAAWAPEDNDPQAQVFLQQLRRLFN